ncbi:hypothetical protein GF415_04060 [Candidatus Micrarchaeota archaeon]|nr:hypothetical protein [Candidatus Micrarchaeota archaeon]
MDRKHLAGGAIIILLILVLLFGGGAFGPGEEAGAGEGGGGIITCDSDEDCPGDQECVAGICKEPGTPTCEEDEDCSEGQVCIEGFCFESDEIPCESVGDCPSGYECVDGFCKEIEVAGEGPLFCNSNEDCPAEQVCQNNVCMSQEEADCVEQGGTWNPDTGDCSIGCSTDDDCPEGQVCYEDECMDPGEIPCDPPCDGGWVCVEGNCVLQAEVYSPNSQFGFIQAAPLSYCEGCPQEDSIISNMFLDPDLDEKTVSAVLFVEEEFGNRTLVEDATIFIQVVPSDGSETSTCRIVTGEDGEAIFDYSEYEICDEKGCRLRFTFCCANITEGCLLPVCLSDNTIAHYMDVPSCEEGYAGEWPEEAYVEGEFFNIYPAVQELSIPAQPQVIGTAFTFDLCFPVMAIFALLSAAMFATGRNPFRMFSLYTPRFKRAPMRAIRARGMTFNINSLAGSVASLAQGIGAKPYTMQDRAKTLKKGVKNLRSLADGSLERGPDGKIRKVKTKGISGKGKEGETQRAGAAARGAEGAMGMQQETAIDLGDAGAWAIETGATHSVGRAMGVLAAMMGTGLMKKVLAGSGIFSWLIYGTRNSESLVVLVSKGLKNSAAPRVMAASGSIFHDIVHQQGVDAVTGEIVITYTEPETGETREARFEEVEDAVKFFGDRYAGALVTYARAANLTLKQLREDGSPIVDACENVIEIGENEFGLSVSEEISHSEAIYSLNDPTLSSAEVPGVVLRAKSLEGIATDVVDSSAFGGWVTGLETRVSSGETIPDSELRLAAAVFNKGYNELGGDGLNDHANLARLGGALVNATSIKPGGEPPSPDELAFAEYSQSLVAAASADAGIVIATDMNGNNYDLGMEAIGTLSVTSTMGEAALGAPLGGVGELESHPLRDMHETFSGEATPARYKAASEGLAEAEQLLLAHAKDIVYSEIKDKEGGVYDDGTMQYLLETRGYLQRTGDVEKAYEALVNDLDPTRGPMGVVGDTSQSEEKRWEAAQQVGNYVERSRMDSMATTIKGANTPPSQVEQLVSGGEDLPQEQIDQQMQTYYDLFEPGAGIDVASLRADAREAAEKLILPFSPMSPAEPMQKHVGELRETVEVFRDAGHQSAGSMLSPESRENIVDNGYVAAPEAERPEDVQNRIAKKQVMERERRESHAMQKEWERLQKMRRIAYQESHDVYHESEEVLRTNQEGFDSREYE